MRPTNIISYNLNGIRAALTKGWATWISQNDFDIIGVQETKANQDQVDISALRELGFEYDYWHSATSKKGYSGVAIFSKIKPDLVKEGMGIEKYDQEGRVLRADFGDVTLLNCYFPSGTSGDERQEVKYDFLNDFYDWAMELKKTRPNIVVQGDYNIAHTNMDIHNPANNQKTSGFLPEERAWLTKWLGEGGFVDSYRYKYPTTQKYSWWSARIPSNRTNNKGWRIDYQTVTEPLKDRIVEAQILNDAIHSDHCPCQLTLNLNI